MIVFKNLSWKNFLSTGNNWSSVDIQKATTTLVVGQNGAGKSTMLDALAFALFGKAHRNISKNQLINSINKKGTIVEVVFTVSGSEFKIIRGIKPNIFEIWKNGVMINQDSHAKEYQKVLEQNILKLNHKSFHQIVVLGSSSFIPFMQLSANHRKDVIEDLLDINVFSKMNGLLKEQMSSLREKIKDTTHKIELGKTRIDSQKKYIKDIKAINKEAKEEKQKLIDDHRSKIDTLQSDNMVLSAWIEDHLSSANDQKEDTTSSIQGLNQYKAKFNADIKKLVNDVKFFEDNDACPTCTQPITEETKQTHISKGKTKAKELSAAIETADKTLQTKTELLSAVEEVIKQCQESQSTIHGNNQSISNFQDAIDRTQKEIDKIGAGADIEAANNDLTELLNESDQQVEVKLKLNEDYQYGQVIAAMLKDTGIKTKIIKQYLPVINKLCNQYLQILDFFVHFNLDEAFSETIRSRHRDDFTYDSFSEGEKQRIDLALLFTWRQIAKMKNSVATNLLILDETFDSSLDHDGVDNLMKIIYSLGDETNVFVISHKGEILEGRFANKIEFIKDKNFSKLKDVA